MKKLVIIFLLLSSTICWALPECQNTLHNCQGRMEFDDGAVFVGSFYNNEFSEGTFYYPDGNVYTGPFQRNKMSGKGTYTWSDGSVYTGDFLDDMLHGHGSIIMGNQSAHYGDTYVGEYAYENYNGYGTYTFGHTRVINVIGLGNISVQAGDKYVGYFKNGEWHGEGTLYHANGRVQQGVWENNKFLYAKKITPKNSTPEYTPPTNEVPESDPYEEESYDDNEILMAGSGTGFAVTKSGYVVTNHHVGNFCDDIYIHDRGNVIPASLISSDSVNDLALLKGNFKPTNVFPFSRKKAKIMQTIYVAGYPFGKEVSSSIKVTKGIVSSLSGTKDNFSDIQVDAAIQVGNSGGPIYNEQGNVIAVIKEKLNPEFTLEAFGVLPENVNYGVKSHVVVDFLESNDIKLKAPNSESISTDKLGEIVTGATYYLSCHMTWAKIKQFETQKVMFKEYFE